MLAATHGGSVVMETTFEHRFLHVDELRKVGANIFATAGRREWVVSRV